MKSKSRETYFVRLVKLRHATRETSSPITPPVPVLGTGFVSERPTIPELSVSQSH